MHLDERQGGGEKEEVPMKGQGQGAPQRPSAVRWEVGLPSEAVEPSRWAFSRAVRGSGAAIGSVRRE